MAVLYVDQAREQQPSYSRRNTQTSSIVAVFKARGSLLSGEMYLRHQCAIAILELGRCSKFGPGLGESGVALIYQGHIGRFMSSARLDYPITI